MSPSEPSIAERLATPVEFLPGVGPARVELLHRLDLRTARDVLFFFPRDYQDLSDRREPADLEPDKLQTVRGTIEEVDLRGTGPGRCVLGVLVRSGAGCVRAMWFNQPYLRDRYSPGQHVFVSGKARLHGLMWEFVHPRVEFIAEDEPDPPGRILPVYPATEGLPQYQLRKIVGSVAKTYAPMLEEVFPAEFLESHQLCSIGDALANVHFPSDRPHLDAARRRLIYQELFVLQLALAWRRRQSRAAGESPRLEATAKIDARIRRLFPFELTPSQNQAIAEIAADLNSPVPMNRLLQGDVGSGKTIVAAYAVLLAVAHGCQAAIMAPTEVLARQHAITFERLLAKSSVRRVQLRGGMAERERTDVLLKIAGGEADLVIGTQAMIQADVHFRRLGLVVIDEQHKFGVLQRANLKQAGANVLPHYLVMTATPIPRSVTMTLFGDLDLSTLRESPPGRQPIHTYLAGEERRERWWQFFCRKLREGRQGYVVVPLVEGSEQVQATSLDEAYENLANGPLEAFRLGLVHGRMTSESKDAVMNDFRSGKIQVLVCTSVVEVGVDVANATLMTIESAERFGLAQLHQLRGRICRGAFPGFCCAFSAAKTEEALARLKAFVESTDGFKLAEIDFELRGPGDLFGVRQHGLPPFRIADLSRDAAVLAEARVDAKAFIEADPDLGLSEHARLRRMVTMRYGQVLELGDVG